jgi:hypothetical protein
MNFAESRGKQSGMASIDIIGFQVLEPTLDWIEKVFSP